MRTSSSSLLTIAALTLPLLTGCAIPSDTVPSSSVLRGSAPQARGDVGSLTYRAVDQMLASAPILSPATPLVVSSISSVEDLDTSTPLGNIVADLVRARLVQKGLTVSDLRVRRSVLMRRREGEMMLSRNMRSVLPPPNAAAIVTGTYAVGAETAVFSLKIVSASDSKIISAADFVVPLYDIEAMLASHHSGL